MSIATPHMKFNLKVLNDWASLPFSRLWGLAKDTYKRRVKYRRALAELNGLSARELKDMRLSRCDIRRVAREYSIKD